MRPNCSSATKSCWNYGSFANVFTPRPFQIELLECAVKQNTIVCVNTEAGKRFISSMLIQELMIKYEDNYEGSQVDTRLRLAVLILNNDPLVQQQCELLRNHLNLDVKACRREDCSNLYQKDWKNILNSHQVITITPEMLLEMFSTDIKLVGMIDMLIFDDCHLVCIDNHPYQKIMRILDENHVEPNILGLTTALLHDDITAVDLSREIEMMKNLLHAKAQTATDLIALDRNSLLRPTENIIVSADRQKEEEHCADNLIENIQKIVKSALSWLETCQISANSVVQVIDWELTTLSDAEVQQNNTKVVDHVVPDVASSDQSQECKRVQSTHTADHSKRQNLDNSVDTADGNSSSLETATDNVAENTKDLCATAKALLAEILAVLDVLGPWCVYKLIELQIKQSHKLLLNLERKLKNSTTDNDEEPTSGSVMWQKMLLQYVNTKLRMIYIMCHRHMGNQKLFDIKFISPKVYRMLQVLKEYQPVNESDTKQPYKYNDRSEADYVSWWQDSDADDDEEEVEEKKKSPRPSSDDNYPSPFTNTLCGIIFVQEKCIAMMLHRLLREVCKEDKELKHVNSSHLDLSSNDSSRSSSDSNGSAERQKQEEVLRKFRCHETNLIITAASLEDCAYIPKCNLVISFDVPQSYRLYVQSKSRARAHSATYVMLVRESEKREFMIMLQEYKKIEKVLQGPCSFDGKEGLCETEVVQEDYDAVIPPYSPSGNATASMKNAIRIINRYCSRLPSDPFTHLSPRCEVLQESGGGYCGDEITILYRCTLQLPINSHVREPVTGPPMPTVTLAQQAVAVEVCKKLHLSGELDDNLMPIGKETVKYAEELDPWKPESTSAPGRPGSTKRRQTYDKDDSVTLTDCLPTTDASIYLYEIEMKIKSPLPTELNVRMRKIYFPEHTPRCFGILTTKLMPQIPGTPIFTRSGEEVARLRLCRSFLSFSAQQLKLIKSFHRYVFSDMLRVDRVPLSFKPVSANNQVLVVALNKVPRSRFCPDSRRLDIDWKFMVNTDAKRRVMDKMKRDPWYKHRMTEKNKLFKFSREVYEDGVVVAKYRSCDQPNRFYVAEIKDDLNPSSPFPSAEYLNFNQYYRVKYGLDIRCNDQPLLDVDHTSSRLNLLTPRHLNQKGKTLPLSSLEKKRAKYESLHNRQILVPELCEVHPIPASLWRKAVCLPSILYRVSQLLIAEELRHSIALESGIIPEIPPLGYVWSDLDFGWTNDVSPSSTSPSDTVKADQPSAVPSLCNGVVDGLAGLLAPENKDSSSAIATELPTDSDNQESSVESEHTEADDQQTIYEENSTTTTNNEIETAQTSVKDPPKEDRHILNGIETSEGVQNYTTDESEQTENDEARTEKLDGVLLNIDAQKNCLVNGSYEKDVLNNDRGETPIADDERTTPPRGSNEDAYLTDEDSNSETDDSVCSDDYTTCFISENEKTDSESPVMKKRHKKRRQNHQFGYAISEPAFKEFVVENKPSVREIGPGPGMILQALTLSNASDGFNLERLEMLGDSFLKHAVTLYLYCTYPGAHEGKLSYMRSKKVSNYNLYRIGRAFGLAGKMTAHIFDPTVNWMPTGFIVGSTNKTVEDSEEEYNYSDDDDDVEIDEESSSQVSPQREVENEADLYEEDEIRMIDGMLGGCLHSLKGSVVGGVEKKGTNGILGIDLNLSRVLSSGHASMHFTDKAALKQKAILNRSTDDFVIDMWTPVDSKGKPLNNSEPLMLDLHTQHSLADKSIADSVEALLGAYLTTCGHRAAQLLLCHLGLTVLPKLDSETRLTVDRFGYLLPPFNPLTFHPHSRGKVTQLLESLKGFEKRINYNFKNKAYLLQAFTHASYYYNTFTDCYQRLEFLGDAVLDFLITSYLFNDERQHSPGALTDLRSALVNNTIFASMAVRYDYHKYFKSISPELQKIIEDFVSYQQRLEDAQGMDAQLMRHYKEMTPEALEEQSFLEGDEEEGESEDVEVPKALGDIFESVAGAVFMDSGMSLDTVWKVYSVMMLPLIEKFSSCVPRSPVRELLEMEPETAKFSCAEKRYDGKIRVTVEVIGKGRFKGVGRSYRIAKSAAARRALRFLKKNYY